MAHTHVKTNQAPISHTACFIDSSIDLHFSLSIKLLQWRSSPQQQ